MVIWLQLKRLASGESIRVKREELAGRVCRVCAYGMAIVVHCWRARSHVLNYYLRVLSGRDSIDGWVW